MKPTLNQLINFCTVAETGNIGKAASQLNISQPPLSRQIAQLETILGAKLFNRAAKGVSLTLAGEQFLLDCRAMLAMLEQACNNVRAIESGQKGVLKLGATMYASYSVVPHVAMQHRNTCSDVELHFQERVPSDLHAALQDGRLDAAISFSETATPGIHSLVLLREPLIATVPRESAPMLYDSILHQCLKAGFSPQIGLEASVQQTVMNFVAHGVGVALIPASMENAQLRGVVYRKLENPNMVENMLMWSAKNTNPALPGFVNLCRSIKDKLDAAQSGRIND